MTITATRYATINSVPLDTYGWRVPRGGYDDLLNGPALRGRDVVMPTAIGVRPYPRKITGTPVSIPLLVVGGFTENGAVNADPIKGMLENRDYLRGALGYPEDASATRGTVTMTFVRGSGLSTLTGSVVLLGLNDWTTRGGGLALWRIDLLIPGGELA